LNYTNDFETVAPESQGWSSNYRISTAPRGQRYLGDYDNQTVQMNIACLPPHQFVRVSFDLYIIRSWDGNNTEIRPHPDTWIFMADDRVIKRSTFSNWANSRQSYPGDLPDGDYPAGTGTYARQVLGYGFGPVPVQDTVYRMTYLIPHTDSSISLKFIGRNLQGVADESWGLDNFRVEPVEPLGNGYYLPVIINP
jgi:hypothetical protein